MLDGSARGPTGPAGSLPKTPHHLRQGVVIDNLIRSLEAEWRLGLKVRDKDWSPQRISTDDQADKAYGLVKRLFYFSETLLNQAIGSFGELAPFVSHEKRLELLQAFLASKLPKPKLKDPVSRTDTPRSDPPKNLKQSLIGEYLVATTRTPHSGRLSRNLDHDEPDSYATAVDPGSPTDVDTDDEFVTARSPSPSPSSRSAQRRVQASPFVSLRSSARKRPSDSSDSSSKSPKMSKTSQGKQAARPSKPRPIPTPPLFKKPSRDMAPSFQAAASGMSSVNTSFNDTMTSSQETSNTTNTSFTSYDGTTETRDLKMTRTSSITIGSLDDYDLLEATSLSEREVLELEKQKQLDGIFSQELSRESRSTFGSTDEDGLRDVSCQVEGDSRPVPTPFGTTQDQRGPDPQIVVPEAARTTLSPSLLTASFPPRKAPSANSNRPIFRPRSASMNVSPHKENQRPPTPADSPQKVIHHIRDIPKQNLFVAEPSQVLNGIPYFILFISQRIASEGSISLQRLMQDIDVASVCSSPDAFWNSIRSHSNTKIALQSAWEHSRIWQAAKRHFDGYTFKGRISFSTKRSGQVFNLQLLPIHGDKSCRFQRKFGSDRFLYLTAPVFDSKKTSRFNMAEMSQIESQWHEWLAKDHFFLGRTWRVFHVEPIKKGKGNRKETTHDKRIILFATEGLGIEEPYTIGSMLNWFLPFALNEYQSFCKAYARLDLGLSRTVPTLVFKPSQVNLSKVNPSQVNPSQFRRVHDTLANGEREDTRFNDPELHWENIPEGQVMNDGCSKMSVGAAKVIWRLYKEVMGLDRHLPLPSAFQGRIGGAKGLWMISGESSSQDADDTDIWIQISDSQLKFSPHKEDLSDETYDLLRLTFEVSNYSSGPTPSKLHISFIPIMIDRGVSKQVIADFMTECLEASRSQLLDVLMDPARTYNWLYRSSSKSSNGSETAWQAALPVSLEEKLKLLLESGFSPLRSSYLARNIERFITTQQIFQESTLRTPLGKSTYLFGIADPFGVLKPGEIHVQFSANFVDEMTESSYLNLRNLDVLVARQPACRRSDIQKARAVVCPELNHLVDVVVFPSRGEYPLAGKLQGGDYDGDIFWLCWESRLVDPFKNAPAPVQNLDPTLYGIATNQQKVKDIMDTADLREVDKFLQKAFEFRSTPSLLGRVTVFLEKQAYREKRVFSRTLDRLCDLHDLLVDAPKQGYTFTSKDFDHYIKHTLSIEDLPKVPAYKAAMEDCSHAKEVGDVDKVRDSEYRYSSNCVLDYLYFQVVRAHNIETIRRVKELFSNATTADETLLYPCMHLKAKNIPVINEVLCTLEDSLPPLHHRWASGFKKGATPEYNNAMVEDIYREFRALQPIHVDHPEIRALLEPYTGPNSFSWDKIRASTLYAKYHWPEKANFVFKMAGAELADLKSRSIPRSRRIVPSIYGIMRPKRIKAPIEYEEDEDSESEDEFKSAMEQVTV